MSPSIRIGIVDDHPMLREGVANTLKKRADLQVVEQGASAEDAMDIAQRERPDVMLMDVNMPGDVFAAVRFIATELTDIKVLMLTVSESENDAFLALEAGARGYVLKGISGPQLVQAIRSVAKGETFVTPELADKLLETKSPQEIAAMLVQAHRASMPEPEELLAQSVDAQRAAQKDRHREGFEDTVWFRMDIGRRQNADPRWLLPLLCRRGHITRNEIGAIRISANETFFQIPRAMAARFNDSSSRNCYFAAHGYSDPSSIASF